MGKNRGTILSFFIYARKRMKKCLIFFAQHGPKISWKGSVYIKIISPTIFHKDKVFHMYMYCVVALSLKHLRLFNYCTYGSKFIWESNDRLTICILMFGRCNCTRIMPSYVLYRYSRRQYSVIGRYTQYWCCVGIYRTAHYYASITLRHVRIVPYCYSCIIPI